MNITTIDVLVVGGGAAGTAAAWQASKLGVSVLLAEESPWIGGKITAAGVSAFDGNKDNFGTGFFRRLRDALEEHYGGPMGVATGWISDHCFEPSVALRLLNEYMAETNVLIWHGAKLQHVITDGYQVLGARFLKDGEMHEVRAKITVDATEYGDVIAEGGIPFSLGRESKAETGEPDAPEVADLEVQDLTWCATLKMYPDGAPKVPAPAGYDPSVFNCALSDRCTTPDPKILNHGLHDWESFITYASLPNDKYLLNWPFHANDSPDTLGVFGSAEERQQAFRLAKQRTLSFVHFMQNELGHPEWGLATDEYGTEDNLAHIPYMRESRRAYGMKKMMEKDVLPVGNGVRAPFHGDSIAIGDYFLDHHHSKMHLPPGKRLEEKYPANAPFMIPYGCVVPKEHTGLLLAEKNISVSHIVNGCTRLQPCVMLTGQAVGAAAALCIKHNIQPHSVDVRELQDLLINQGVALYPIKDVSPKHKAFKAIQTLSIRGMRTENDPIVFLPEKAIEEADAKAMAKLLAEATGQNAEALFGKYQTGMTRGDFAIELASTL